LALWQIGILTVLQLGSLASWQLGYLAAWKLGISNTIGRATIATTTSCPSASHLMDASMETVTLVAIMGAVAPMVLSITLYAVPPGTKPSNALMRVKYASVLSPRGDYFKFTFCIRMVIIT
jgi:hypothetical protein